MDSQHRVQSYTSVFSSHNQTMWTKRKSDLFTFNFHVFLPGPVDSLLRPIVFFRSGLMCYAATAVCIKFLVFTCVFAQSNSFQFEFLPFSSKSFYFSLKYSAKCLFLIT